MSTPFGLPPAEVAYQEAHIHQDKGPMVIGVSIALIALTSATVVLRFIARWIRQLPWGLDDYFLIPALIFASCLCAENIVSVHFGLGKHIIAVGGWGNLLKISELSYWLSVTYGVVHFFVKMSILLLYRRIFTTHDRVFRIFLYTMMVYVTAWAISTVLLCIFQCTPISYFWYQDINPGTGHCGVNSTAAEIATNVTSTVADIALVILPLTILFKLQMSTEKKAGLALIFSVGLFACAASIVRIYSMTIETPGHAPDLDPTWNIVEIFLWTAIEPCVGIVCASFPVIVPSFTPKILNKRFGSTIRGSSFLQKIIPNQSPPSHSGPNRHSKGNSENGGEKFTPIVHKSTSTGSFEDGSSLEKGTTKTSQPGLGADEARPEHWGPLQQTGSENNQTVDIYRSESGERTKLPANAIDVRTEIGWATQERGRNT